MEQNKIITSNKTVACYGAIVAIAAVFFYGLLVMIYVIIRSSATIFNIIPTGERSLILLANGFSIAYSVAVFPLLMAVVSSLAGAVAAVILKKSLLVFNHKFNFGKAVLVSCIIALVLLTSIYLLFYGLLKDWMTFSYPETFLFWFLIPAAIFIAVCIIGGSKLNQGLHIGS